MKILKQLISLVSMGVLAFMLTGCLESPNVTFFEPGVYQGASDPLLGNTDNAALNERFSNQMDR